MSSKNIMQDIAESNKSVTKGVDDKDIKFWAEIFVMGESHIVPADLTIMQAMEYAGYRFTRSCGCRAGFCGACATVYRLKGDYKLKTDMACQTIVEDGMFLVQIPFAPADKAIYDLEKEKMKATVFLKYYPEIARCISCNTCAKACPQDLKVMDYINAALKGDFERVTELSFDCIQCGLCAMRCPADIVQYHVAQLGRRIYGKYALPVEPNSKERVKEIDEKKYDEELNNFLKMNDEEIKNAYKEQQKDREIY